MEAGTTPAPGFLDLAAFGIGLTAIGDEDILNYDLARSFVYNGKSWARIGVDSNGYIVVGGGSSQDNQCCTIPSGPDASRPNNMIAPLWTDLNGDGGGIRVATLSGGGQAWLVVQYEVFDYGTTNLRKFQVWFGNNGVQDVSWAFASDQTPPVDQPYLVGAENEVGQGQMDTTLRTETTIVSSDPIPGGSASYSLFVQGVRQGTGVVKTEMTAPGVPGVTIERSTITVTRKK